jgi:hypothetical protein
LGKKRVFNGSLPKKLSNAGDEMAETKIVMFDSDEAARQITVTGWVSRDGRFYGNDERLARYAGCTHRKCEQCDNVVTRDRIICDQCNDKRMNAKYESLEPLEWDGDVPLCTFRGDTYFFDWGSVEEYCEDHETTVERLQLVICVPVKPHLLEPNDMFCDYLPEDGECPDEVALAVEAVNDAIKKALPFSWYPGKQRAIFTTCDAHSG